MSRPEPLAAILRNVTLNQFQNAHGLARRTLPRVAEHTLTADEVVLKYAKDHHAYGKQVHPPKWWRKPVFVLAQRGNEVVGGFAIIDRELCCFWGPGIGSWLLHHAVNHGAEFLDCFDGFLPEWYSKHGFTETLREPNLVAGEREVVFMRRNDTIHRTPVPADQYNTWAKGGAL